MKKVQFLDSLMIRGCPLHSKDAGSSQVAFPFFQFASLFFFILDFVKTWIYFFESGISLFNKYTPRNVNFFYKPKSNNSLHAG